MGQAFNSRPNRTNNFLPVNPQSDWVMDEVTIVASSAMEQGSCLYDKGDGTVDVVTNATANFKGIYAEYDIAATDSDYASNKTRLAWIPKTKNARAYFTVGAGTFTTADVGKSVKFNDETGLAVDTAGIQAKIVKYISSTRGICEFNQDIT